MIDSFKHQGRRQKLVEAIALKGITDPDVLAAVGKVPRHLFMESFLDEYAYVDKAFPIPAGQTISQPYTVAFQTQLLELKKGEKVLEIGTGSGYQTAILAECRAKVFSIERHKVLHLQAKALLEQLGYKAFLHFGDGFKGLPTYGPFDKILITAGAEELPHELLPQLKLGGALVLPLGGQAGQVMTRIVRTHTDQYQHTTYGNFAFVPMLRGTSNT